MPENNDPKKEPGEKRQFIIEKIVQAPMSRKQIAKRLLAFLVVGVLFGVVAAVSFAVSSPLAVRYLGVEPSSQAPTISIPRDEPSDTTAVPTEGETTNRETEAIEEVVQSAMENYRYTVDDLKRIYGSLRSAAQDAEKGIVKVHSVQLETDWFDNPVETSGLYAGAVIVATRQEVLILTPEAAVSKADSIKVMFADGTEVGGSMKQQDRTTGMAIVSVNATLLTDSVWKSIQVIPLGNSYTVKQGDLLIAIGSPAGVVYSMDYGFVSYIMKNVQVVDGVNRILYSRIGSDTELGTFLINPSGELIGWATPNFQNESNDHMTQILGISDYKGILESLTNGQEYPCFGILIQEVGENMSQSGLPQGLYVQSAVPNKPAYNAGIQNGDIITQIDGEAIHEMKDFQKLISGLHIGQVVNVTVQRNGRDQYAQLEFQVTIEAR